MRTVEGPMQRLAVLVAGAVALTVPFAVCAQADPSDDAVSALRSASVYVGADAPKIDKTKLGEDTLGEVKVAILPTGGPNPVSVARSIGQRLDPDKKGLTVLVFEGHSYGTASSSHCGAATAIDNAVESNRSQLQSSDDVTSTVIDFAAAVRKAPSASGGCDNSSSGNTDTGSGSTSGSGHSKGSDHTGTVLLVLLLLLIAGVAYYVHSRRRRARERAARTLSDARAQVTPYYDRLANEVNTINPGSNATARQAMADASERFRSAGGQLATADSLEKYAQARRTTLEGLYAARTARTALGLDPGPELPPIAQGTGDQLNQPQEVTVQGQTFQGYPDYRPGAPYYYGGGYGVPGGWYGVPFWETLLLGSVLTGGFGGFGGGWGGFDAGYGTGYDAGYNAGEDAGDNGSGNDYGSGWGDSGGGGDWGDGGGWGDSGAGGDWGGGGGDGGGSW
ncbi:MAG: hypothetical protein ABR571_15240 [Jatrophihabitans sp.]|uniref:hypothetical protein n=1 Tax=Jatrophihabitans sp. TaxID=1932789 RepID=UPI00391683CC